jgi:hypothetical protein
MKEMAFAKRTGTNGRYGKTICQPESDRSRYDNRLAKCSFAERADAPFLRRDVEGARNGDINDGQRAFRRLAGPVTMHLSTGQRESVPRSSSNLAWQWRCVENVPEGMCTQV